MADNYLEKKFEQLAASKKVVVKRTNPSLDTLLRKNREAVGFDSSRVVTLSELKSLLSVVTLIDFPTNRQHLRFKIKEGAPAEVELLGAEDLDCGMAVQAIGLKAAETGLAIKLEGRILKIGKSSPGSIFLKPVASSSDSLERYTKEGVTYLPKLQLDSLLK